MAESARLQKQCDAFNTANPIGTEVIYRYDNGDLKGTRTRSEASVLSGHTPVVWVEDISGCVFLDRVRPSSQAQRKEG